MFFALVALVLLVFLPMQHWRQLHCDHSVLVAGGPIKFGEIAALFMSFIAIFCFVLFPKNGQASREASHRRALAIGAVLFVGAAVLWLDSVFTYYCAYPGQIDVRSSLFASPVKYGWGDVSRLAVGCSQGRSGYTMRFDLTMRDGYTLPFGQDSWSMTEGNYSRIAQLLSQSAYVFDNQRIGGCTHHYRFLFLKRPT
jgi:hypothetical protein